MMDRTTPQNDSLCPNMFVNENSTITIIANGYQSNRELFESGTVDEDFENA